MSPSWSSSPPSILRQSPDLSSDGSLFKKSPIKPEPEPVPEEPKTEASPVVERTLTEQQMKEELKAVIPRFYFWEGKPAKEDQLREEWKVLDAAFDGKPDGITENELMQVTKELFCFPGFMNKMLFSRICEGGDKVSWG